MSYDDLSLKHWLNIGPAIRELAYELKITKGRSVYMRIGANGDFNAQTVFHPHFHVVVSDGRPISREMVAPSVWALIEGHRALIESAFRASQPELFELTLEKGTVQEEALKFLWFEIGKIRSHLTDKAGEIRPKFSNKAFFELPLQ